MMPYPGDPPVQSQQGRLNLAGKRGVQTVHRHVDPSLMSGLPWEDVIIYIRLEQFLASLLIFGEEGSDLLQVRLGDADDDMPPCPQINLDSQSFEGFLLQDLGQLHARPTFVERFIGTKDISTIQDLILLLIPDWGGSPSSNPSSTGLL